MTTCTNPLLIPVNHKDNISFKYIKRARKINTKTKGHWISPSRVSWYKSLSKEPASNAGHCSPEDRERAGSRPRRPNGSRWEVTPLARGGRERCTPWPRPSLAVSRASSAAAASGSMQEDCQCGKLNPSLGEQSNSRSDRLRSGDPGPSGIDDVPSSTGIETFWTFTSDT